MIDVKQTLAGAEERMEMAAMFLEESLNRVCVVPRCSYDCHPSLGQEGYPRH